MHGIIYMEGENSMEELKKGNIVTGLVTGVKNYGIFVKISDQTNGLIHISEISDKYVPDINKYAKIGDNIRVKIIDIKENEKKLDLSIKGINSRVINMEETGNGFELLGSNIDKWIDEYEKSDNY